jgi:hypothetical protein
MPTRRDALRTMRQFELSLDGPHVTAIGWEGSLDAPDGYSFNGQYRSVSVAGLTAAEFWRNVIETAALDGPELCRDERKEI